MSAQFRPPRPVCHRCGQPVQKKGWVAWTIDDDLRMTGLWIVCGFDGNSCHTRLPRDRHDLNVSNFLGSKRAFFLLEDIVDTYHPNHQHMLELVRFCSWAARQPKDTRGWYATLGEGDPAET